MVAMEDVVVKLAQRTAQGRVPWKTAVGESSFSARLGNLLVLITSSASGSIKLSVNNEKGTEIDSIIYLEGVEEMINLGEGHPGLPDLFASAKRTALGTDQRLSELMKLLDEAPPTLP
jgi:hypothetical protein